MKDRTPQDLVDQIHRELALHEGKTFTPKRRAAIEATVQRVCGQYSLAAERVEAVAHGRVLYSLRRRRRCAT
jgi:hypothetical protein